MAKVYADLIRKGLKTIDDVPERIREQVKQILIDPVMDVLKSDKE
jgi:hypothetical protein|nr:MAG TPA: hypothetical protein [Herelleviridae sp.]